MPENMVVVDEAKPLKSVPMELKKLLPPPPPLCCTCFCVASWEFDAEDAEGWFPPTPPGGPCSSILMIPFFVAASLAVLVKSPSVDFPTYVRSSKVFLLTPAACLETSNACFEASPAAFLACSVNCEENRIEIRNQIQYYQRTTLDNSRY